MIKFSLKITLLNQIEVHMLHKNTDIEQKHDLMVALKDKKAKLEELKNECLHATGFFNHFKRRSLNEKILVLN